MKSRSRIDSLLQPFNNVEVSDISPLAEIEPYSATFNSVPENSEVFPAHEKSDGYDNFLLLSPPLGDSCQKVDPLVIPPPSQFQDLSFQEISHVDAIINVPRPTIDTMTHNESVNIRVAPVNLCSKLVDYSLCDSDGDVSVLNDLGHSLDNETEARKNIVEALSPRNKNMCTEFPLNDVIIDNRSRIDNSSESNSGIQELDISSKSMGNDRSSLLEELNSSRSDCSTLETSFRNRVTGTHSGLELPGEVPLLASGVSAEGLAGCLTYRYKSTSSETILKSRISDNLKEILIEKNVERGVQFTVSQKGNDQMLLDNNVLKKNKGPMTKKKGLTINWVCIMKSCPFKATTIESDILPSKHEHNHDPTIEGWHKRVGRAQLKNTAGTVDASLAVVVMDVVAATSNPDYVVAHGSTDSMKQAARRYRKRNLPGTGKLKNIKDLSIDPIWFEIRPNSGETLLLFDNGKGNEQEVEGRRIVVLGSKHHLKLLVWSTLWMGDGTFSTAPKIGKQSFYQLYTLAGMFKGVLFTFLRVLMQRKDAKSYKELFSFIKKCALDNGWSFNLVEQGGLFLTDYEWSPHAAKNQVLR